MRQLVDSILRTDPSQRPDIAEVYATSMHQAQKCAEKVRTTMQASGAGLLPDASGVATRVMEWLKVLDWENGFLRPKKLVVPPRHYFAVEAAGGTERFSTFCGAVAWMLERTGSPLQTALTGVSEREAVINLVAELKQRSLRSDYKLPDLARGFGSEVCQVLEEVAELSAKGSQWEWKAPKRQEESEADEIGDEDESAMILEAGDAVVVEEEEPQDKFNEEEFRADGREVIHSQIKPEDWEKEAARAAAPLGEKILEGRKTWAQQISQMVIIKKVIAEETDTCSAGLQGVSSSLTEDINSIQTKENAIQERYHDKVVSYEREKSRMGECKAEYTERTATVEALAASLSEISESLDEVKDQMGDHSGKMEDSSPVLRLKKGVQQMKAETAALTMRIGVAKQLLTNKQQASRRDQTLTQTKEENEDL